MNFSNQNHEHFLCVEAPTGLTFSEGLKAVSRMYKEELTSRGLSSQTEVCIRYYLSDISNQAEELRRAIQHSHSDSFISVIGQPPASGAKIAMTAYHITADNILKTKTASNSITVTHGKYRSLWHACRPDTRGPSDEQTKQVFKQYSENLAAHDATMKDNSVRTWIYVRDVDNNYQGMVDERIAIFNDEGLTRSTHYIASTGIEGCGEQVSDLVFMDSLSIAGLQPGQRTFLTATDYLCPTHDYNVTFERGTTIRFGDRAHHYISGTASIDREGNVLYLGDVVRQTRRTLENIQALLQSGGSDLEELRSIIVYLRDVGDYEHVKRIVESTLPEEVAAVYVRGAVCRPQWLVEIEGIAITPFGTPQFPDFA